VPSPPRHLLLVRHGQSTWNAEGRWQGQADPPLSALGEQQAREAVARLAENPFTAVFSSDLRRARQTAEVLAGALGVEVQVDRGLREIDVGDWTGLTRAEIEARWPGELAAWSEGRSESPVGGETRAHLVERARAALARIAGAAAPDDHVLLVTHGALIRHLDRAVGLAPRSVANLAGRWYKADGDGLLEPAPFVSMADPEDETPSPSP
jgi:probable phosphoglycerate mutase